MLYKLFTVRTSKRWSKWRLEFSLHLACQALHSGTRLLQPGGKDVWLCTKAPSNCQACNLEVVSSQRGHVFLTYTRILHRLEKNDVPFDNLATFSFFILYILKLISLSGILLKFYKHCVIWFSQQPTITSILLQHAQSKRILSGRVSIWTQPCLTPKIMPLFLRLYCHPNINIGFCP